MVNNNNMNSLAMEVLYYLVSMEHHTLLNSEQNTCAGLLSGWEA
jgi:hypothetical protein